MATTNHLIDADKGAASGVASLDGSAKLPVAQLPTGREDALIAKGKTVAPNPAVDDITLGYTVGSRWFDETADKEYVCLDNTDGAAVWVETTSIDAGGSNLPEASGLIDGAVLSVNGGDNTKFDLSAGTGQIVDAKTTPSSPTITPVTIAGATAITVTNLATQFYTYILVDSAGSIIQQATLPTSEQLRTDIFIGKLNHANKTNLASAVNTPSLAIGTSSGLEDLMQEAIGVINATPMVVSSGGANLNIDISGGDLFQIGVGYDTDKNKPHIKTFAGFDSSVTPFVYVTSNTVISAPTNVLLPTSFESPLGTVASVASNKWTNQRVYKTLTGNVLVMYGQVEYNSKALALEGLYNEVHSTPGILTSGEAILIGIITLVDTATDSTNTNQVVFQQASKFGEYAKGSAGISTGTLQAAYDNSTEPEIFIPSGEALSLQSATDGAEIVQDWKDELGNVTASITGDGTLSSGGTTNSTGVLSGGELSVGAGGPGVATTYDISDGTGQIVTNTGVRTKVSWTGLTGQTPIFGPSVITFVAINSGGTVTQQSTPFSRVQSRTLIPLGVIVHVNGVNVDTINNEQEIAYNPMATMYDAMESIGFFNVSGNIFSANGANMTIDKSLGSLFKLGSNYDVDPDDNPHVRTNAATVGGIFQYRFSDGSSGILTETNIDPDNLDDGGGGLTAVGNNQWSVQRIYIFTSNNIKIQRGVAEYPSSDAAIQGIPTEGYVTEPSIAANGLFRGWLVVKKGATTLNGVDAIFLSAGKFGESGGSVGSGSTTTLQAAYDNSVSNPEILTDATNGALTVRRGSIADTDTIYEGQNNAGTITFSVDGNGNITTSGTVDGIDIATDVAANTAKVSNVTTDLSIGTKTTSTVDINSSDGLNATIPSFTSTEAGLVPSSGGGTSNFLRADGTWTTAGGGGGDVTTDTIWDAAGDLVYGTGADTGAKLPIGTANQKLRVNSGATAPEWVTEVKSIQPITTPSITEGTAVTGPFAEVVTDGITTGIDLLNRAYYSMTGNGVSTYQQRIFVLPEDFVSWNEIAIDVYGETDAVYKIYLAEQDENTWTPPGGTANIKYTGGNTSPAIANTWEKVSWTPTGTYTAGKKYILVIYAATVGNDTLRFGYNTKITYNAK